jgi:hypothetical protein
MADPPEFGGALAPEPDFRHVTVVTGAPSAMPWTVGAAGVATVLGTGPMLGLRYALCAGVASAAGALLFARRQRRRGVKSEERAACMSIVPWGVIVDDGEQTRVLRWGAIASVEVETVFGRDQATDVTRHSVVVVETGSERLMGRTFGDPPLARLLAHREAYAREAEHVAAIDLDGGAPAGEAWEPQVERLLLASCQLVRGGGAGVENVALGYRGRRTRLPSEEVATRLRAILRDRTDRVCDPRPLGAILAAELGITSLAPELAQLVASPHPLTAATARAAGLALGLPKSRLGVVDEVAPFLPDGDVEALAAWTALRTGGAQ